MRSQLNGRVCLVTGATSGIGEATARGLARLGATVIVHGRDLTRCETVAEHIRQDSGNSDVAFVVGDLASMAAVRGLSADLLQRFDHLHVLINNAGAMYPTRRETVDGLESTFAVNHLAPFLLTNLLLDVLQTSAPSRIINVSSGAHRRAALDFTDLESRDAYEPRSVYARSKLMNLLFSRELARRLAGTGVTVNALAPGIVHTEFGVKDGMGADQQAVMDRGIAPDDGARTSVFLASSPDVEGVSGGYFTDCAPAEVGPFARDDAAARRLWDLSADLVSRGS